jgi:hypothetical protein
MADFQAEVEQETPSFGAEHTLFVEGSGSDPLDEDILKSYLQGIKRFSIEIKSLGGNSEIKSAASALHAHHKNYYFVIDRDYYNDNEVEKTWLNFPDETKNNLLIWRKRELENYFISPDKKRKLRLED